MIFPLDKRYGLLFALNCYKNKTTITDVLMKNLDSRTSNSEFHPTTIYSHFNASYHQQVEQGSKNIDVEIYLFFRF